MLDSRKTWFPQGDSGLGQAKPCCPHVEQETASSRRLDGMPLEVPGISATLLSCHPSHAVHCFFLIPSLFVGVCASLGKARWMKHCQWHLSMNTGESWLPSEVAAGALQAVPEPAGAYSRGSRLSPELCQEPAHRQAWLPAPACQSPVSLFQAP